MEKEGGEQGLIEASSSAQHEEGDVAGAFDGNADAAHFAHFGNPDLQQYYLEDAPRLGAFREAIAAHADLLRDKVVLDLGCGTGVLSVLCAQAGAKHVYAVDPSAAAVGAAAVVKANGLESRITVIQSRIETAKLPVRKVDVILCDWMGPCLLSDSLLRSLLWARDRLLQPDGIIMPDVASLYLMGIEDPRPLASRRRFWAGVYGVDASAMLAQVVGTARQGTVLRDSQLLTPPCQLLHVDLYALPLRGSSTGSSSVGSEGGASSSSSQGSSSNSAGGSSSRGFAEHVMPFKLTAQREQRLSALMAYFTASFTGRGRYPIAVAAAGGKGGGKGDSSSSNTAAVTFSTHPRAPDTNVQQTLLSLPRALKLDAADEISGSLTVTPALPGGDVRGGLLLDLEVAYLGAFARAQYRLPPQ